MSEQNRFENNGDGTVTDHETQLMWMATDTMADLKKWVNYQEALDYARELKEKKFAGYEDWRLPTKDEMTTLYDESYELKDRFGKIVHIPSAFEEGCGISMIAQLVTGRFRTWVMSLREGTFEHPDGLWTLSDSARAVRTISSD